MPRPGPVGRLSAKFLLSETSTWRGKTVRNHKDGGEQFLCYLHTKLIKIETQTAFELTIRAVTVIIQGLRFISLV